VRHLDMGDGRFLGAALLGSFALLHLSSSGLTVFYQHAMGWSPESAPRNHC